MERKQPALDRAARSADDRHSKWSAVCEDATCRLVQSLTERTAASSPRSAVLPSRVFSFLIIGVSLIASIPRAVPAAGESMQARIDRAMRAGPASVSSNATVIDIDAP